MLPKRKYPMRRKAKLLTAFTRRGDRGHIIRSSTISSRKIYRISISRMKHSNKMNKTKVVPKEG
jgi:hypothetical protein